MAGRGEVTVSDGHDPETGRFLSGNTGGPGRPQGYRQTLAEAFLNAITVEDMQAVAAVMLKKARGGDTRAAQLILDRFVPKAATTLEVRAPGGGDDPWPEFTNQELADIADGKYHEEGGVITANERHI